VRNNCIKTKLIIAVWSIRCHLRGAKEEVVRRVGILLEFVPLLELNSNPSGFTFRWVVINGALDGGMLVLLWPQFSRA
jgi:hypothetical protein